jgi:hypothetical protein
MMYRNRKILAVVLISILMLVYIPIIESSSINDYNSMKENSNINEQGLMFFWFVGHLKDVDIYYDERLEITVYNGTVVSGIGITWAPKLSIVPLPGFILSGDTYLLSKEIPELHTRILQLPNDHILFSMWFFGIVNFGSKNETASFPLNQFLN